MLSPDVAATETAMLETVLQYGTAKAAALGEFAAGKTGTTSNYVDAWFVGWDNKYTVAVWVGYPEGAKAMSTDYDGGPVLGGTFPALIWHDFMISALQIEKERAEHAAAPRGASAPAPPIEHDTPPKRHAVEHGGGPGQTTAPTTGAGAARKAPASPARPVAAGTSRTGAGRRRRRRTHTPLAGAGETRRPTPRAPAILPRLTRAASPRRRRPRNSALADGRGQPRRSRA